MKRQTSIVFLMGIALAAAVLVFMAVVGTGGVQASSAPPTLTVGDITTDPEVPLLEPGESILISAVYTDPSGISIPLRYTAEWDWGNSQSSSCEYPEFDDVGNSAACRISRIGDPVNAEYLVEGTNTYTDPGIFPVVLTVKAFEGESERDSDMSSVEVEVVDDNVPPTVGNIIAPMEPVNFNDQPIVIGAVFTDPEPLDDRHTAEWIWGDDNLNKCPPDSDQCTVHQDSDSVAGSHIYSEPGVYAVDLLVTDSKGLSGTSPTAYVVVYDPAGGFVTGGGWINSPPEACPKFCDGASGKATFGFVSKYKKGASVPIGNTQFQFQAGYLNFHSDSYDWLVVNRNGSRAQFKGNGTINGQGSPNGDLKFQLWATDGDPDTFRIKIWWETTDGVERVVYDNVDEQTIGGGSIVVHTGKKK